jgi:hypothetical protein
LLVAATTAIVSFARGRGGNPWLWGALTVVGYFLAPFAPRYIAVALGIAPAINSDDAQLLAFCSSILWVAILAFCSRFILGRKLADAGGMSSCPNCKYLNQHYAVICEACRQPYSAKS